MMTGNLFRIDLVFRIHDGRRPQLNKFDKKPLFIKAKSDREAYQQALVSASRELDGLNQSLDGKVKWEFIGFDTFESLAFRQEEEDVTYVIENPEDAIDYMRQLRLKNNWIQTKIAEQSKVMV